jgi:26S proteasome regulatory subunit N7
LIQEKAIEAAEVAFEKTAPIGHRIDILFSAIRIGYFHLDNLIVEKYIDKVNE